MTPEENFGEPWHLFGYGQICDAHDQYVAHVPHEKEESGRRLVACVNACAGISTELVVSAAFREPIRRFMGGESYLHQAMGGGEPLRIFADDAIAEIEAIVERVLATHGLLPQPGNTVHQHTARCHDYAGKMVCGGAAC